MLRTIETAGYGSIRDDVVLRVTGTLVRAGDGLAVELDRMRSPLTVPVASDDEAPDVGPQLAERVGQRIDLEGRWKPEPDDGDGPGSLAVIRIHEAGRPRR